MCLLFHEDCKHTLSHIHNAAFFKFFTSVYAPFFKFFEHFKCSVLQILQTLRWVHTLEPILLYSYVYHLCQNGYRIHYVWAHSGRLDWLGLGGPGCRGWGAVVGQSRDTLLSIWHYPLFHKCNKKIGKYKKQAKPNKSFFLCSAKSFQLLAKVAMCPP